MTTLCSLPPTWKRLMTRLLRDLPESCFSLRYGITPILPLFSLCLFLCGLGILTCSCVVLSMSGCCEQPEALCVDTPWYHVVMDHNRWEGRWEWGWISTGSRGCLLPGILGPTWWRRRHVAVMSNWCSWGPLGISWTTTRTLLMRRWGVSSFGRWRRSFGVGGSRLIKIPCKRPSPSFIKRSRTSKQWWWLSLGWSISRLRLSRSTWGGMMSCWNRSLGWKSRWGDWGLLREGLWGIWFSLRTMNLRWRRRAGGFPGSSTTSSSSMIRYQN